MSSFYPTIRVGAVWLTAVAILSAGLPYGLCRCPNGNVKLFCFGLTPHGGCCDGGCCPGAPAQSAPKACCCHGRRESNQRAHVGSQGCQKTLMPAVLVPGVPPQSDVQKASAAGPFLTAFIPALAMSPTDAARPDLSWHCHQLPPPTDLVVAHQRLVI